MVDLRIADADPWIGWDSYTAADAAMFFGREEDASRLQARILSSCVTLLYARSGAGKTSLLNTKTIPSLEAEGWSVVRARPLDRPTELVIEAALNWLIPPVEQEIAAITAAAVALSPEDGTALTLPELLQRYNRKKVEDYSLCRRLLQVDGLDRYKPMPTFTRLLRGDWEIERFIEHIDAVRRGAQMDTSSDQPLSSHSPVGQIVSVLNEILAGEGQKALQLEVERLWTERSGSGVLLSYLRSLTDVYGCWRKDFRIVLVLDQFEELFTLLSDPGPGMREKSGRGDLSGLRWEFIKQLRVLYEASLYAAHRLGSPTATRGLNLRIVFSMRADYIAELDAIREFVPALDQNAYHLSLLNLQQAREAIEKPAQLFKVGMDVDLTDAVLDDLSHEQQRFVHPAELQMVCKELYRTEIAESGSAKPIIRLKTYKSTLKGFKGIAARFVDRALDAIAFEDDRREALDILQQLITTYRTRNSVDESLVIDVPFAFPEKRSELLSNLKRMALVRSEWRLGRSFIEISHDILVEPIYQSYVQGSHGSELMRFRRGALGALRQLSSGPTPDDVVTRGLLRQEEFQAAHEYRRAINFLWMPPGRKLNGYGPEIMLRAALRYGGKGAIDDEAYATWSQRLDQVDQVETAAALTFDEFGELATHTAVQLIEMERSGPADLALKLNRSALENAFRSCLRTRMEDRSILHWARSLAQAEMGADRREVV